EPIVKEFLERFPDPEDTPAPVPAKPPAPTGTTTMRVASQAGWFAEGALLKGMRLRLFAVAMDLFLLSVTGLALFAILGMFWAPLCLATAAYYSVSILLLGNTPGVCLFADPQKRNRVYLTLMRQSPQDVADSAV